MAANVPSPVHSDPARQGGTLVFRDTRVPAQTLLDHIHSGGSLADYFDLYPTVRRADAREFLRLATGAEFSAPAKLPPIYQGRFPNIVFCTLTAMGGVALCWTIKQLIVETPTDTTKIRWLAFWILGPAFWFSIEYHWLYRRHGNRDSPFEIFKYSQDGAAKFWAAVVALVAAIALKKAEPAAAPKCVDQQPSRDVVVETAKGAPSQNSIDRQ